MALLKNRTLIAILAASVTGCTSTNFITPTWSMKRASFLQRLEVPDISIATNGTVTMKGYKNDGGNEAVAAITAAAVAAAINAAK